MHFDMVEGVTAEVELLARGVAYGARAPKPYVSAVVAISVLCTLREHSIE